MSEVKNLQTKPNGLKTKMKKLLDRELRTAVSDYLEVLVESYAKKLAAEPPIFRQESPSVPEEFGWFYFLGEVCDRIYQQLLTNAQSEAEWLMQDYRLATRPDAGAWQRWLSKRAAFWTAQLASRASIYIAELIRVFLSERYGVSFAQHYEDEAVMFFIQDATALEEGWEVVHDGVANGCRPEDPGYLRVVYAYHPARGLLLRLHHTRIHLPWGRQAVKWIIARVWWDVSRNEAESISIQ